MKSLSFKKGERVKVKKVADTYGGKSIIPNNESFCGTLKKDIINGGNIDLEGFISSKILDIFVQGDNLRIKTNNSIYEIESNLSFYKKFQEKTNGKELSTILKDGYLDNLLSKLPSIEDGEYTINGMKDVKNIINKKFPFLEEISMFWSEKYIEDTINLMMRGKVSKNTDALSDLGEKITNELRTRILPNDIIVYRAVGKEHIGKFNNNVLLSRWSIGNEGYNTTAKLFKSGGKDRIIIKTTLGELRKHGRPYPDTEGGGHINAIEVEHNSDDYSNINYEIV